MDRTTARAGHGPPRRDRHARQGEAPEAAWDVGAHRGRAVARLPAQAEGPACAALAELHRGPAVRRRRAAARRSSARGGGVPVLHVQRAAPDMGVAPEKGAASPRDDRIGETGMTQSNLQEVLDASGNTVDLLLNSYGTTGYTYAP